MTVLFSCVCIAIVALYVVTVVATARLSRSYPSSEHFIDLNGRRLHCAERGTPSRDRPSLIFLHGASSNHREFIIALGKERLADLSKHWHLIFLDRPGQGGSDRAAGDQSPRVQADLAIAAAKELGAPSVIAIGHSWGASVVAQMAVHGGDFVQGAVFCAPATHPWPGERFRGVDWFYAVAGMPIIGWLFTRLIVLPVAWNQIGPGAEKVFAPDPTKPDYADALGARLVLRPKAFQANAQDVYQLRPFVTAQAPTYVRITCPVQIITGNKDKVVWPEIHSDGLARDISGAHKTVIEGGGHMPHQTHPDLVLKAIDAVNAARLAGSAQMPSSISAEPTNVT
ncbi:MAG: alpha/beta hydrolase [Pseudomonadota bacterium]